MIPLHDVLAAPLVSRECTPTGLSDLDSLTGGVASTDTWLVCGRPRVGRTMFALQLARLAALANRKVAVLLGHDPIEVAARTLVAQAGRVPLHHLIGPTPMSVTDDLRAAAAVQDLSELSISFIRRFGGSLDQALADARDADLIVIDDLDLWSPEPLSALHRLSETRKAIVATHPGKIFTPDGWVDQEWARAADVIIRLSRDDDGPRPGEADLEVLSHRRGPDAVIAADFLGFYATVRDPRSLDDA